MSPETVLLAERAKRIQIDCILLCQETGQTLRRSENLRAESQSLRGELQIEFFGFMTRARRAVHISRGAGA
jgi:hypothetical protein